MQLTNQLGHDQWSTNYFKGLCIAVLADMYACLIMAQAS